MTDVEGDGGDNGAIRGLPRTPSSYLPGVGGSWVTNVNRVSPFQTIRDVMMSPVVPAVA